MASYVRNIRIKNYQNLIIGFKITVKNVGDFFETQCIINMLMIIILLIILIPLANSFNFC